VSIFKCPAYFRDVDRTEQFADARPTDVIHVDEPSRERFNSMLFALLEGHSEPEHLEKPYLWERILSLMSKRQLRSRPRVLENHRRSV
jgi:hypothetical protein